MLREAVLLGYQALGIPEAPLRMFKVEWELQYSAETEASLDAAWNFWTNVANWVDPPAQFELHGPFEAGSNGLTRMPGQETRHWLIRDAKPPRSAVIEMPLDGAMLSFHWNFDPIAGGRTRLTQRVILTGENARAYIEDLDAGFRPTLAAGMERIAAAMNARRAGHV